MKSNSRSRRMAKWAVLVGIVGVPVSLAAVEKSQAQPKPAALPLQTLVELVPSAKMLQVKLSVVNSSDRYEMFQRNSCGWQAQWRSDKPGIALHRHRCRRNVTETIILPPHQSHHEKPISLLISGLKPSKATFRFGLARLKSDFTGEELERIYHSDEGSSYFSRAAIGHRYKSNKEVFWSNPAVVHIRPEWIMR